MVFVVVGICLRGLDTMHYTINEHEIDVIGGQEEIENRQGDGA